MEVFAFFQGKKLCSLQALNWHWNMYIRGETVQCLNVLVKKPIRTQEPSFSHAWGYWNLVFISEAIWARSCNQFPQNILPSDKSLNEHLDHSGGSWVSTHTSCMTSAGLVSTLWQWLLRNALCLTVLTPLFKKWGCELCLLSLTSLYWWKCDNSPGKNIYYWGKTGIAYCSSWKERGKRNKCTSPVSQTTCLERFLW